MHNNFRQTYYKTLGVLPVKDVLFQFSLVLDSVEVIEVKKLVQLTLKFGLPTKYQEIAWKLIVGILPYYRQAWSFVQRERNCTFEDIVQAAEVLGRKETEDPILGLYQVYYTSILGLPYPLEADKVDFLIKSIRAVCREEADCFWCLVGFIDLLHGKTIVDTQWSIQELEAAVFDIVQSRSRVM